jgi:uncharacterized cupredoxin-like copper-binding protein
MLLAILLAAVLAGCRPSGPPTGTPSAREVAVAASEFKYDPRDLTAAPGELTFVVRNVGAIEHNFVIEDPSGQTIARIATIDPGKTERLTVTLPAGSYVVVCTYPGHREAGMVGTLSVRP